MTPPNVKWVWLSLTLEAAPPTSPSLSKAASGTPSSSPSAALHLTNDLAVGLRAPFAAAEEIKDQVRHRLGERCPTEEEIIELAAFGDEEKRVVSRREVAEILERPRR